MSTQAAHRHFHDELSELKVKLLTMSGEAEDALAASVQALLERDRDKASAVITGDTEQVFTRPRDERTEAYITGRFG